MDKKYILIFSVLGIITIGIIIFAIITFSKPGYSEVEDTTSLSQNSSVVFDPTDVPVYNYVKDEIVINDELLNGIEAATGLTMDDFIFCGWVYEGSNLKATYGCVVDNSSLTIYFNQNYYATDVVYNPPYEEEYDEEE